MLGVDIKDVNQAAAAISVVTNVVSGKEEDDGVGIIRYALYLPTRAASVIYPSIKKMLLKYEYPILIFFWPTVKVYILNWKLQHPHLQPQHQPKK